ncbi:16S rRNA (cytidine(1402)-2'-O)-methyltransferase [Celeribacter halophilus]|uniref:Ribosomal RNA small subunit methyltransferase I n=1 Tax=Celeribacter halophilus TaxID=576117 RepID=A0AAW7XS22_9RHOB|nr:16S rRNA (cytidine(1402)-2'-O)-methyltransferase [Celeribacter halophilus]MBU2891624.1 16S rRNA (cytidine(1402)-2'-O)-methyltransferase [Celeribacter halophilus]MDO6457064.1 16S rRNA (cytidine(1402)-2'-O)-methyltransferase [Celeribacter halophilus]MDO6509782.1 16S rRNA (cytidine(1402)-2'-O)-methyltransferase [Celeribacter halophilus]MDO6723846.1 16S rRNA (cytidine(1402)-2'-O)-methyltransferase [Celeribacter halophilus]
MTYQTKPLSAGLHFLATPIGNARDITLRALDILASADVLAAEDTRSLRKLMDIHGVPLNGRHIYPYHDHNGGQMRPRLIELMEEGKSVAYASEAGTPLVADPGFALCREALSRDIPVTSAPGPSAMIAALTISGLPSDRFLFAGFPPSSQGARLKFFSSFASVPATLGFYESPKRVHRTLGELCDTLGETRQAALCRELTKRFEEVRKGTLRELEESLRDAPVKGEIVLLIDRAERAEVSEADLETALAEALEAMTVKDAAADVAARYGLKKRDVYQMALAMKEG